MKTSEVIARLSKYVAEYGDLEFELFCLTGRGSHRFRVHHFRVIEGKSIGLSIAEHLNIRTETDTFTNAVSRDANLPYERGVRKA